MVQYPPAALGDGSGPRNTLVPLAVRYRPGVATFAWIVTTEPPPCAPGISFEIIHSPEGVVGTAVDVEIVPSAFPVR